MMKKNKIRELLSQLEHEINNRMNTFKELGKEAKALLILDNNGPEVDKIYINMAAIVDELRPVLDIVKQQNPNLEGLLDTLLTMHDKKINEKHDSIKANQ
jgi:hypothetical protein